jgi:hypothetical protein
MRAKHEPSDLLRAPCKVFGVFLIAVPGEGSRLHTRHVTVLTYIYTFHNHLDHELYFNPIDLQAQSFTTPLIPTIQRCFYSFE